MTAGEHYDEESLIELAEDRPQQDTDKHLVECEECRSAVDEYRTVITCMADGDVWAGPPLDEAPNPETIATLRSFVDRMQQEDAEAAPLVAELLAGSREEWMPRLMSDSKYRTAGVVRALIAATDRAIGNMPPDALEMATVACNIADTLHSADDSRKTLFSLRGVTHLDRAYALFCVGKITAAREETVIAGLIFENSGTEAFNLARVHLTAAQIARASDDVAEGLALASRSKTTFEAFGEIRRAAIATATSAYLLTKISNFRDARRLWTDVLIADSNAIDEAFRGDLMLNIGYCERELGDLQSSLEMFRAAEFVFETLQIPTRVVRARYNVAALLVTGGSLDAAAAEFVKVISELERLGMFGVAAVASLDLAEVRILQKRHLDVQALCDNALNQLQEAGLGQSSRAFRALSLLREAAVNTPASSVDISGIRSALRQESPHLLQLEVLA